MKSKLLVTVFIAVIALIAGCDSLWQVSDTSDITFTIDTSALQGTRSIQASRNGVSSIDSDVSKITVSIHNANDDSVINSKTETLSEDGKAELEFKKLRIVGKTVYAKAMLESIGVIKEGRSEAKRMVRGANRLEIAEFVELEFVATPTINVGAVTEQRGTGNVGIEVTSDGTPKIISQEIVLACDTPDATIYYTTGQGSFDKNTWIKYTQGSSITTTSTVRAVAVKDGWANSVEASKPLSIMPMVYVEGGSFRRKTDGQPTGRTHQVLISSFIAGKYEVTVGQWKLVMNEDEGGDILLKPISQISWYDAIEFCNNLSLREGFKPVYSIDKTKKDSNNLSNTDTLKYLVSIDWTANGYRLPTRAEWEYIAGGGENPPGGRDAYNYGSEDMAWLDVVGYSYVDGRKAVGTKLPNNIFIYDAIGNVTEFCWDWQELLGPDDVTNPKGALQDHFRVGMGASYFHEAGSQWAAIDYDYNIDPSELEMWKGFRVVRNAN